MAWYFSPLEGTKVPSTSSLVVYDVPTFDPASTVEVRIHGTDLTFDSNGFIDGGTIQSMELVDVSDALNPQVMQNVIMEGGLDGSVVAAYLAPAKVLADEVAGWSLAPMNELAEPTFTATGILAPLTDGTFLRMTGTGFLPAPQNGTVESLEHLDTDGVTVLHSATGLPLSALAVFEAFGMNQGLYLTLTQDANTISSPFYNYDMSGGAGNDIFVGDATHGGSVSYDGEIVEGGVTIDLAQGIATSNGGGSDTLIDITDAVGSQFADTITGTTGSNHLFGESGNDTINGLAGEDVIFGHDGADTLTGGGGNDQFWGDSQDVGATRYADVFRYSILDLDNIGDDTIHDFDVGLDKIRIEQPTGFGLTFANLPITSDGDGNAVVGINGASATLMGVAPAELTAADFEFVTVEASTPNPGTFDMTDGTAMAGDVLTATETLFVLDDPGNNQRLIFEGSFTYGAGDTPEAGQITSVKFADATGRVGITVTDNLPTWSMLQGLVLAPLKALHDVVDWVDVIDKDAGPSALTATQIVLTNTDGTKTQFVGAFDYSNAGEPAGNVTSIRHLSAAGALLSQVTSVNQSFQFVVAALFTDSSATWRLFADVLFDGDNHIVGSGVFTNDQTDFDGYGGVDTYVHSEAADGEFLSYRSATGAVTVNLNAGTAATPDGTEAIGTNWSAVGGSSHDDTIIGHNAALSGDFLIGDSGNDTISGLAGADTLVGDWGDDTLIGGAGGDRFFGGENYDNVTAPEGGFDTVSYASAATKITLNLASGALNTGDAAGDVFTSIERYVGTGFGDTMTGNAAANRLDGGEGADTLDGAAGMDSLYGGNGNDVYTVDNVRDLVVEASVGGGFDSVKSSVTFTLGANIETLTLTGAAGIDGTGNASGNVIYGNAGSNDLDGKGGVDRMFGGAGSDTYTVDDIGDVTLEDLAAGGVDTVRSSVSRTLGANFENLTLIGTAAINGAGNGLGNVINGNGAANVLDGGAGVDRMFGGAGNDTYFVDNNGDVTWETDAANGTDRIVSTVSRVLGAFVENLTLSGTGAINGTGNTLANVLIGNSAVNVLSGAGGADVLTGGGGNDRFLYTALGDSTLSAADRIADLAAGDKIDVRTIDANAAVAGNQAFVLDAVGVTTFTTGHVRQTVSGGNLFLDFNTDADATAEMRIVLVNHGAIGGGNILL